MGQGNFTEDFRLDAIKQFTERGHSVADVSKRLGVSTHWLYSWMKRYAASPIAAVKDDQAAEIKRLKQEQARVTEERDILKKATAYFAKDATLTPM
jgi:transposase